MHSDSDVRKFEPATITIVRGSTVTWQHVSGSGHTATADPSRAQDQSRVALPAGVGPWDSGNLSNGKTWSRTFDVPGTYRYCCQPHEGRGMLGTITVTD
jgi:plastocyanin